MVLGLIYRVARYRMLFFRRSGSECSWYNCTTTPCSMCARVEQFRQHHGAHLRLRSATQQEPHSQTNERELGDRLRDRLQHFNHTFKFSISTISSFSLLVLFEQWELTGQDAVQSLYVSTTYKLYTHVLQICYTCVSVLYSSPRVGGCRNTDLTMCGSRVVYINKIQIIFLFFSKSISSPLLYPVFPMIKLQ